MTDFKSSLQEMLEEKGLNRRKLSKIIDISESTLNGYFNSGYYPSLKNAKKLCKYFNCSFDYLLGLSDNKDYKPKSNNKTFFENFCDLIKQNNLSNSKAMEELKMSEYDFYRWRNGQMPKVFNLVEIAKHFNCSIDELLGRF